MTLAGVKPGAAPQPGSTPRQWRQRIKRHCRERCVRLGPRLWLQFEDRWTVAARLMGLGVVPTLDGDTAPALQTLAWLLPRGDEWLATLSLQPAPGHANAEPVSAADVLPDLYVQLPAQPRVYAQARPRLGGGVGASRPDELLRFVLPATQRQALLQGEGALLGCRRLDYDIRRQLPPACLHRLRADLQPPSTDLDFPPDTHPPP